MSDAIWVLAWLSGWIVWLFFAWWTFVQTKAFIGEGTSVLRRVNPVRTVACTWAVLLFSLFSGVGRLHLLWIGQLIMYAPPILSARALRQVGMAHGVFGYVLGFVGITAMTGMAASDLADMVGVHIAVYHILLFAVGGGAALWFRRHFGDTLEEAESGSRSHAYTAPQDLDLQSHGTDKVDQNQKGSIDTAASSESVGASDAEFASLLLGHALEAAENGIDRFLTAENCETETDPLLMYENLFTITTVPL